MAEIKWRFPASSYGDKVGMSTGDSEAFREEPYAFFAREILQNSIDVREDETKPVVVHFEEFKQKVGNIPGIGGIRKAMGRIIKFWDHKEEYKEEYTKRLDSLNDDEESVDCIRISDFNTKGLIGINDTNPKNNYFQALVKGSGVSEKESSVAGGSKGLGKNAAFNKSKYGIVFYSTKTADKGELGSIGVANFISGYVDDDETTVNRDHTQGKGFYGIDDMNNPIDEIINLDSGFSEREHYSGTDIYIIGFNRTDDWEKEVIIEMLDSFMVAIVREDLELRVNDHVISKETVTEYFNDSYISDEGKLKSIISQYMLSNQDESHGVHVREIVTDYGELDLYLKVFDNSKEENFATNKCAMVRYPHMKITEKKYPDSYNVSALCIIKNNHLGRELREIENPTHTEWQTKRIDDPVLRNEIVNTLHYINQEISNRILEIVQEDLPDSTDVEGAYKYLPDRSSGDSDLSGRKKVGLGDTTSSTKIKSNTRADRSPIEDDVDGFGLVPEIGSIDPDGVGAEHPEGENDGGGGNSVPGPNEGGATEGDSIIHVRKELSGVKYKVISTDKENGKIKVIFTAPFDSDDCVIIVNVKGDDTSKEQVEIKHMKVNGEDIVNTSDEKDYYGPFTMRRNSQVVLEIETDETSYFASEVVVNASRK